MYSRLLATTMIASAVFASVDATAAQHGQPSASIPHAPIGHLQPRAPHFSPRSSAEYVEQDRMSAFEPSRTSLIKEAEHLPLLITRNERQIQERGSGFVCRRMFEAREVSSRCRALSSKIS